MTGIRAALLAVLCLGVLAPPAAALQVLEPDVTPPIVEVWSPGVAYAGTPEVVGVYAYDEQSEVVRTELTLDGVPLALLDGQAEIVPQGLGIHTLRALAVDAAGNVGTAEATLEVIAEEALEEPPVEEVELPEPAPRRQGSKRPGGSNRHPLCGPKKRGESCQAGNGRRTPGGGDKVSHKGWPAVTGILWIVQDSRNHSRRGGPDNDELLGHHGSDKIRGGGGKDILWGDWDPKNNNTWQRDVLRGDAGNDWLYPSHGRSRVYGGAGNDRVWAYYGGGTIDCGPGNDTARVRLVTGFKVRNCETINHFCGHGSDGKGGCLKPGETRASSSRRGGR